MSAAEIIEQINHLDENERRKSSIICSKVLQPTLPASLRKSL